MAKIASLIELHDKSDELLRKATQSSVVLKKGNIELDQIAGIESVFWMDVERTKELLEHKWHLFHVSGAASGSVTELHFVKLKEF